MKRLLTTIYILMMILPAFAESKHHDHSGHNHDNHGREKNEIHGNAKKIIGPNGGRIMKNMESFLEFYVMDDGKIMITFLDKEKNMIQPKDQDVSLIGGSRSAPIKLNFSREGDSFVSDKPLATQGSIPLVLQIKPFPEAKTERVKFQLNLSICGECNNKEYVCICNHH